jgi:hypothetical protein
MEPSSTSPAVSGIAGISSTSRQVRIGGKKQEEVQEGKRNKRIKSGR